MDAEFSITIKPKRKEDIAHIIDLLSEPKAEVQNTEVHYDDVKPEPTPEPKRDTPQGYSCPACNKPMAERKGPFGKFYGCTSYPKCKGTRDEYGNNTTKAN